MRPTALHLSEEHCPCLTTEVVFKNVTLVGAGGAQYPGELRIRFRSFLPEQPLMRMTEVAHRLQRKGPIGFGDSMELTTSVSDVTGRYELSPFRANVSQSLFQILDVALRGHDLQLHPIPHLELIERSDSTVARVWTWGAPIGASRPRRGGAGPGFQTQECEVPVAARPARLRIFANAVAAEREVVADWPTFPDLEVAVAQGVMPEADLRRGVGGVCSIVRGATGRLLNLEAVHLPLGDGRVSRKFCLNDAGRAGEQSRFASVPEDRLLEVVRIGGPRVDRLLAAGFEFGAVTGWFDLAKTLDPPEQGFLNLFVYLESLKHNWHVARYGRAPTKGFEGHVNRTLHDLLGQKRSVGREFADDRDCLVHQGSMDFGGAGRVPAETSFRCYAELYALCAASYLALIGWTGQWNSFVDDTMQAVEPYWTPNDLTKLPAP